MCAHVTNCMLYALANPIPSSYYYYYSLLTAPPGYSLLASAHGDSGPHFPPQRLSKRLHLCQGWRGGRDRCLQIGAGQEARSQHRAVRAEGMVSGPKAYPPPIPALESYLQNSHLHLTSTHPPTPTLPLSEQVLLRARREYSPQAHHPLPRPLPLCPPPLRRARRDALRV